MDVFERLMSMTIQPHIGKKADSVDKGYFRLFKEGEKENDLHKIYDFVNGMELGNLIRPYAEINDCFLAAWRLDERRTIEILNRKERILDCVFLAYSLCDEKKLQLVSRKDITNSRLKFELIRQLVKGRLVSTADNMETIAQGIVQLAEQDINLFAFMIKELENTENFYPVMGKALNYLSEEGLRVYANTISLNKYKYNLSKVDCMLKEIRDDRWDYIFTSFQKIICDRWENLLVTWSEKEEYFNDIIINSYANLILSCMIKKYENEDILLRDIEKALDIFEGHLFAWYPNYSRAMSIYFIDITRLYMLKLVLSYRKISWDNREELRNRLKSIFLEAKRYRHYWKYANNKADDILSFEIDIV